MMSYVKYDNASNKIEIKMMNENIDIDEKNIAINYTDSLNY